MLALLPLIAQVVVLVVALTSRNWMFVAMLLPGIAMSVASAAGPLGRARQKAKGKPSASSVSQASVSVNRDEERLRIPHLPTSHITDGVVGPLWQLAVRSWIRAPDLRVSVGVGPSGAQEFLDLTTQGPHALVAGTTGSGKSVLLQSWCSALALRNSPEALHFVLLDFKGGATFRTLHRLPHVVGFVSDLNLAHAKRALRGIEAELKRRETLLSRAGVGRLEDLTSPPARVIIVVDEFHALRFALPDYMEHLVRIASQGRSLGMHLILATQNPSGQVNGDMSANINLNVCLRVRDRLQSQEMVGSPAAADISPDEPGTAIVFDADSRRFVRASTLDEQTIVHACQMASRFCALPQPPPLFSDPLPRRIGTAGGVIDDSDSYALGLCDDGLTLSPYCLSLTEGNVAVVGPDGRGKTTLLTLLYRQTTQKADCGHVRWTTRTDHGYLEAPTESDPSLPCLWLVDGADTLLDPLGNDPLSREFREALGRKRTCIAFSITSARHLHYPQDCSVRIIFPTGDLTADMMAGIPAEISRTLQPEDLETPGRAVLITPSFSRMIQCFAQE